MTLLLTDRPDAATGPQQPLDNELLKDELADLLAASIEIRQLLWNFGPQGSLGLDKLLGDLARDCLGWTDRIAQRLWSLGVAPSTACLRPLLRPDPTGGRRLDERTTGMIVGHLTTGLTERTAIRAENSRLTDDASRGLLRGIERELNLYATLAIRPERLVE